MVRRKVRWTQSTLNDKLSILEYWIKRNHSNTFSKNLDQLFEKAIDQLAQFPEIGKITNYKTVCARIIRRYFVFYRIDPEFITILRIWDTSRDPGKLKL